MLLLLEVLSIIFSLVFLAVVSNGSIRSLIFYVDMPTLLFLMILTLPLFLNRNFFKDFTRCFKMLSKKFTCPLSDMKKTLDAVELLQKQLLCNGAIGFAFSTISILTHLTALEVIGPNLAVALISILYTAVLELLLLPLQNAVRRRINDYLGEDSL